MELEMPTDTNVSELVINKLTKEQYASAEKDVNALYMITDEEFVQSINGVSPIDGDLAIKTINGQSILGDGNIIIEGGSGSATVHEVHGVADGSTTELPLGLSLESANQVISVNIGNTLILPTLWSLNSSKSSIVLSNAIEDGTMWSVVFTLSCSVGNLPIATTETVGVVKVGDNLSIDSNGVLSASISTVSSSIIPDTTATYDLGSEENRFNALYVNEAYLSTNTLYLGDTPVLGTTSDTINIKADEDQSILVKTTGEGSTQLLSDKSVDITSKLDNSSVNITARGNNGAVNISGTKDINLTATNISLTGTATITNLNVTGTTTTVHSKDLSVKDNLIEINAGETGSGVTAGSAGLKVNRGDLPDYRIMFDESDDMFKVGMEGDLETIASQDYVSTQLESYSTTSEINDLLDDKQDKLVSGTNIKTINGQSVLGSGNIEIESKGSGNTHSLLDFKWTDHILNEMSWLRADTFSWQSGDLYTSVYNLLVSEYQNGTEETEGSITFKRSINGYKITTDESAVSTLFNESGVAWYYILDTNNRRFKLPRTKWGFTGLRDIVGENINESLPNISGQVGFADNEGSILFNDVSGVFSSDGSRGSNITSSDSYGSAQSRLLKFNASNSSSTYQDNAPVQQRATQMYLYFYVGEFSQTAIEQTAGITTEVLNNKADVSLSNINASSSSKQNIVGWGLPDYSSGVTATQGVLYTASNNCYLYMSVYSTGDSSGGHVAKHIEINGTSVVSIQAFWYSRSSIMIACKKGDTYKFVNDSTGTGSYELKVFPCIGG